MIQSVFPCSVNEAGTRLDLDRSKLAACLASHAGKRLELVLRAPKSKRSLDMNAYLHADTGPFRLLADYFGDSIEGVKYDLMGEFFGWAKGPVSGNLVPVKAHTSDMTVEESRLFVDWVIPFGASHGVLIPLPSEVL